MLGNAIVGTVLEFAKMKSGAIARYIGKDEQTVNNAIEQGAKMLPEILNSQRGGIDVLEKLGVEKSFIKDMYGKYKHKIANVPFISEGMLESQYNRVMGNMRGTTTQTRPTGRGSKTDIKSRYPDVN